MKILSVVLVLNLKFELDVSSSDACCKLTRESLYVCTRTHVRALYIYILVSPHATISAIISIWLRRESVDACTYVRTYVGSARQRDPELPSWERSGRPRRWSVSGSSRCSAPAVTRASLTASCLRRPGRGSSSSSSRLDDAHAPIGFLIDLLVHIGETGAAVPLGTSSLFSRLRSLLVAGVVASLGRFHHTTQR